MGVLRTGGDVTGSMVGAWGEDALQISLSVHCVRWMFGSEPEAYWKSPLSRTVRPLGSEHFRTESGREEVLD